MDKYEKTVKEFLEKLLKAKTKKEADKIYEEGSVALSKLTPPKGPASKEIEELWYKVREHLTVLKWHSPCTSCGRCSS